MRPAVILGLAVLLHLGGTASASPAGAEGGRGVRETRLGRGARRAGERASRVRALRAGPERLRERAQRLKSRLGRSRAGRAGRAGRERPSSETFVYDPQRRSVLRAGSEPAAGGKRPWRRMPLGATYLGERRTAFVVWAPRARTMDVLLYRPGEAEPYARRTLSPGKDGYFHGVVDGVEPGAHYKYALHPAAGGAEMALPDPASRFQPQGVHGPSEVVDHQNLTWSRGEASFRPPRLRDMVIYQLHTGTFSKDGTLAGAARRMPEVAGVGFNAAQPLPVTQFPGGRNWGYDPAQVYAVHNTYGGPEGLKTWVESTHAAGMAAILDVVYNHPGPEGNYLGAFGPYFEGKPTPWGRGMTASGKARPEVYRYFIENALQWVATYHADGLRIDASHALPPDFLAQLKRATDDLSRRLGRRIVIIAEDNRNDGSIVRPTRAGGRHKAAADSQWSTDPWHAWRVLHTGEKGSYLKDFAKDPLRKLAHGVRRGWIYEGQTAPSTGKPRGTPAGDLPAESHVLPMGDHDQYGNTPTGDRLSARVSERIQRSTDFMRYLLPVVPQVFMGDEWGTRTPFLYFVDHGDPAVREATRAGRMAEFKEFFAGSGQTAPDPTAEDSYRRSVLDHGEKAAPEHARRLALTRALIDLRRTNPALRSASKKSMQVLLFDDQKVLVVRRWAKGREVLAAFNVGDAPAKVDLRGGEVVSLGEGRVEERRRIEGHFRPILSSEDKQFGGAGRQVTGFDASAPLVELQPHTAVYFDSGAGRSGRRSGR